jgi:hypothetical protein
MGFLGRQDLFCKKPEIIKRIFRKQTFCLEGIIIRQADAALVRV